MIKLIKSNMKRSSNLFAAKVAALIIITAILAGTIPFGIISCAMNQEPVHYFKIQRLNFNGDVQQTYYSKNFPNDGDHYIYFRDCTIGKLIQFSAPYTAEDIGTNKP
jgi:hypothetical protein